MLHRPSSARQARPFRRSSYLAILVAVASGGVLLSGCGDSDTPGAPPLAGSMGNTAMPPEGAGTPPPSDGETTPPAGAGETTPPGDGEGMAPVAIPGEGLTPPPEAMGGEATGEMPVVPPEGMPPEGMPPVTCDLPTTFRWTSSQPIITPKPPAGRDFVSIKDPTIVTYEGTHHVFATVYETTAGQAGWKSVYLNFTDLAQADAAPQTFMQTLPTGNTVAPQIFFFEPQNLWYLIYQWGARYSTNPDINNPNGWTAPRQLLVGEPAGALDFWVICDDTDCHMFFSRDDGVLYKSKTTIANFPNFNGFETVMADTRERLFEASNVYKVDGTNKYLLLVEAFAPRYFRSWTSESLDGPWTALADTQQNPFAGAANVTFGGGAAWTNDISHGELIRSGFNQRLTINACNMQFLYQGTPNPGGAYELIPYDLGLLTLQPAQ
jgi:hypothetical protein